ncbi:MAG: sugar ABC transporter substrate-binding protein [Propionibacteriaceae bacterium]|nr:sugar ABC transporter substrate-binding protein [Propionibacteriaceae bacterium]
MSLVRKTFVTALAVATASAVLAGCGGGDGGTGGGGSAAPEVTSLTVFMPNYVLTDYLKTRFAEFTKDTGIEIKLTTAGDDQLDDQYKVAFNARSSEIDVLNFRPMQNTQLFGQNGWLEDLTPYLTAAPAEYQADDLQPGTMEAVTVDGAVVAIPSTTERQILYYRKDLLAAAGLAVPETFEDLQAAVEKLHNPDGGVYGFVGRGAVSAAVTQLSSFLYGFGGDWTDGDKGTVDSEAAIKAYEFYGGLLREYGPPGTQDMSWQQSLPIFAQGKAAFYPEGDSFFTNFLDESQSVVKDSVGFAVIPAGPAGHRPYNVPNTAFGVSAFSEKKEAAWKFIQWATSPEMALALQTEGVPQARNSAWADDEVNKKFPEDLRAVIVKSIETGVSHDRPQVREVSMSREIVGKPLIVAQNGGDVAPAAQQAAVELTELIAQG